MPWVADVAHERKFTVCNWTEDEAPSLNDLQPLEVNIERIRDSNNFTFHIRPDSLESYLFQSFFFKLHIS